MTLSRPRVPLGLPITAIVLFVLGLLTGPLIQANATEQQLAANVLLNAIPFILISVSIILVFVTLIWAIASSLNDNISRRIYRPIELALIAGIVLGVAGMFQPWLHILFRGGFYLLLFSTLGFILWSHVRPSTAHRQRPLGSLDISDYQGGADSVREAQ